MNFAHARCAPLGDRESPRPDEMRASSVVVTTPTLALCRTHGRLRHDPQRRVARSLQPGATRPERQSFPSSPRMGARPRAPDVARPEPFIAEASNRREFRDTAIAERLGMAQAAEIVERELKQTRWQRLMTWRSLWKSSSALLRGDVRCGGAARGGIR
jgi:hypothetical protein